MQNFKESDRCNLFRVIARQKIDNLHTDKQMDGRTHIHTFSANDFIFNLDHIWIKKIAKFDNRFLTPIQGFTI